MRELAISCMVFAILVACQAGRKEVKNKDVNHPKDYVEGELIVAFKNEATYRRAIKDLERKDGAQFIDMLMVSPPDAIIGHFKVPVGQEKEMMAFFEGHPEVKSSELNALGSFNAWQNGDLPVLTVTKIENGKDGYMAHLEDGKKGKYVMLVSIPNLGDKYVDLKIGDRIRAEGSYAESDPIQIFAKSIEIIRSDGGSKGVFIKGKVESIENGKDGYAAKIRTPEGKVYFATISIPNLGREHAHQYQSVSVGETI